MSKLKLVQKNLIWTRKQWFGPDQNDLVPIKMIWTVQNHFGQVIWPIFRVSLHFFFVAVLAFKSVFRHFSHLRPSLPYISVIRPLWIFRLEFWSKFFKNSETILWLAIRCISDRNFWRVHNHMTGWPQGIGLFEISVVSWSVCHTFCG